MRFSLQKRGTKTDLGSQAARGGVLEMSSVENLARIYISFVCAGGAAGGGGGAHGMFGICKKKNSVT